MVVNVTIKTEGSLDRPVSRLRVFGERALDPGVALIQAADEIADANIARIESGKGLKKLAAVTIRKKTKLGQPTKPLQATKHLLASLKPGAPDNILKVYRTVMRYGTSDFHAHLQTNRPNVPKRRVISVAKPMKLKVAAILDDYLTEPFRG